MLKEINSSAVIYLDAHPCGENSGGHNELVSCTNIEDCPFYQNNILNNELSAISRHYIKDHIIILDDQHGYHNYTQKFIDIINVNNDYINFFVDDVRSDMIVKDMQLVLCPIKYKHLFNL